MSQALFFSLDSRVSDFADLLRIVDGPLFSIQLLEKRQNRADINKIDKSVADITVIFQINR